MTTDLKSAGRILDMMEMLAATTETVGLGRVAETLGLPKSSAQGLLATLIDRGYLARVGLGYAVPAALRSATWADATRARLLLLAAPALQQMSKESGESAYLAVLVDDEIQYLARELSSDDVRYDASLAHRRPVYCTASGIVILAQQRPEGAKALLSRVKRKAFTPHTVTDPDALLRWMQRAKRDGVAVSHDGYLMGGSGIAAPVFGPAGDVLAAVAVGGPTARLKEHKKRLIEIVVEQAGALSRRLSGFAPEGSRGS
jgi:IclR family transcriptional regulator, pca regulon regulatory protein